MSRGAGRLDPLTGAVQATVSPVTAAIDNAARVVGALVVGVGDGPVTARELARLRALEASWSLYAERVRGLERDLGEARRLLGTPDFGRSRVAARVVGYFPYQNRVTLLAGRGQRVEPGMPVVTAEGLVGVVQTVGDDRCQALLVNSPALTFGGLTTGQVSVPGLLKGHSLGRLVMDVVDTGPVRPGDTVETSGYSDAIPRGIPVGTVVEVVQDRSYGVRRVFVLPHARIGDASQVWILR